MNSITQYLNQIVLLLILGLAAMLGTQARNLYRKYVTTEIKQSVCRTVVRFVEQVYKDLHGPEKLAQAALRASEILEEYGIQITQDELIAMLEAAVNEFNNNFGKTTKGRHESYVVGPFEEVVPDAIETGSASYTAAAAETGGTASLSEIIADLKDEY